MLSKASDGIYGVEINQPELTTSVQFQILTVASVVCKPMEIYGAQCSVHVYYHLGTVAITLSITLSSKWVSCLTAESI